MNIPIQIYVFHGIFNRMKMPLYNIIMKMPGAKRQGRAIYSNERVLQSGL